MPDYHIVPPPKNAQFHEWDCQVCGHETLSQPVFLSDGLAVIAAGTGCAARLLYGDARRARTVKKDAAAVASQAESWARSHEQGRSRAQEALQALDQGDAGHPVLQVKRQVFQRLQRRPDCSFREWLVREASEADPQRAWIESLKRG